jgi:hypothetical protein
VNGAPTRDRRGDVGACWDPVPSRTTGPSHPVVERDALTGFQRVRSGTLLGELPVDDGLIVQRTAVDNRRGPYLRRPVFRTSLLRPVGVLSGVRNFDGKFETVPELIVATDCFRHSVALSGRHAEIDDGRRVWEKCIK